jgi:very-short-patch-repair endonuclease
MISERALRTSPAEMSHPDAFLLVVNDEYSRSRLKEPSLGRFSEQARELRKLASLQYGVFTRGQARILGIAERSIDRRLRSGHWERLHEGVYRLAGVLPSWHQSLMAAVLWLGKGAVISHRAAAALWELDGVKPGMVELCVLRPGRHSRSELVIHVASVVPPCDRTMLGPLPVTTISRTLLDLGAVADSATVGQALDDALRRGQTSLSRLRWRLDDLGGHGRRGVGVLRKLLDERDLTKRPPESILERRILELLRESRLPLPISQYEIRDKGRVLARLDLAYPEKKIAIEADSYRYHSGKSAWERDLRRRNLLTSRGWNVLHITWDDLARRRSEIVQNVSRLLGEASSLSSERRITSATAKRRTQR